MARDHIKKSSQAVNHSMHSGRAVNSGIEQRPATMVFLMLSERHAETPGIAAVRESSIVSLMSTKWKDT
jgi:hypothetical protein